MQEHHTWILQLAPPKKSEIGDPLVRRSRIKMQFLYLHFKHPNIWRTSDYTSFMAIQRWSWPDEVHPNFRGRIFFGGLSPLKFGRESSFEVRKMLGCLKCKYENCIFIRERL